MRAYALTMYQSGMVGEVGYSFGICDLRGHLFACSARAFFGTPSHGCLIVKGHDARLLQGC